jgi:hypothetical protein
MSDPATNAGPSFLERWGPAAVVTLLSLFALELAILTPAIRFGVDVGPIVRWINATFGAAITVDGGQPSWWLSLGLAYAITRGLKPVQLGVAAVLTPIVGRWIGAVPSDAKADGSEAS